MKKSLITAMLCITLSAVVSAGVSASGQAPPSSSEVRQVVKARMLSCVQVHMWKHFYHLGVVFIADTRKCICVR